MRKVFGYIAIFALGCLVTLLLLRGYYLPASQNVARRNLMEILKRPPITAEIPDNALVKAAARIEPAVVNIDTVGEVRRGGIDPYGSPFERSYTLQGKGSGVIISPDGYIVTNNHVVDGASIIRVTMVDGKKFDGRIIGAEPAADLAVVKIDVSNLPTAEFGDSDRLKVGEYVIAIGYPLGLGTTVTHGIISATDRRNLPVGEGRVLRQAIQTDAPINKGNSGGALANLNGQLIGINTAIASENGGGNIGIGFAIPVNAARSILQEIIQRGRALPTPPAAPFIGIRYRPLLPEESNQLSLPVSQGVLIERVEPLTPAADAGLQPGDIILSVDGQAVMDQNDVRESVNKKRVGDRFTLQLQRRDGTQEEVIVTLGRRPEGMKR